MPPRMLSSVLLSLYSFSLFKLAAFRTPSHVVLFGRAITSRSMSKSDFYRANNPARHEKLVGNIGAVDCMVSETLFPGFICGHWHNLQVLTACENRSAYIEGTSLLNSAQKTGPDLIHEVSSSFKHFGVDTGPISRFLLLRFHLHIFPQTCALAWALVDRPRYMD
ncbi:hypothetical protein F5Y16DRAFT_361286 [Xylariaceae sp. FL0255]|nr:hypothetical protein F5Y16DRAFT_361286 [Xylariaceae sp. FL0255]